MRKLLSRILRTLVKAVLGLAAAAVILFFGLRVGGMIASAHARKQAFDHFAAYRAAFEQTLIALQESGSFGKTKSIDVPRELRNVDVGGIYVSENRITFSFEHGVSPFIGQGIFYIRDGDGVEDFYTLYPIDGEWVYYQYSSI